MKFSKGCLILILSLIAQVLFANELCLNLVQSEIPEELRQRVEVLAPVFVKIRTQANPDRNLVESFGAEMRKIAEKYPQYVLYVQNRLKDGVEKQTPAVQKEWDAEKAKQKIINQSKVLDFTEVTSIINVDGGFYSYEQSHSFRESLMGRRVLISKKHNVIIYVNIEDDSIVIRDLKSHQVLEKWTGWSTPRDSVYNDLKLSPDGNFFSFREKGLLVIYDIGRKQYVGSSEKVMGFHRWSPSSRFVLAAGSFTTPFARIYDLKADRRIDIPKTTEIFNPVFIESKNQIINLESKSAQVYELQDGDTRWNEIGIIKAEKGATLEGIIPNDEGEFWVASRNEDDLYVYKIKPNKKSLLNPSAKTQLSSANRKQIFTGAFLGLNKDMRGLFKVHLFNQNVIAVASSNGLKTYDLNSGQVIESLDVGNKPTLSEDGRFLVTPSKHGTVVVSTETGKLLQTLTASDFVRFSQDSKWLFLLKLSADRGGHELELVETQKFGTELQIPLGSAVGNFEVSSDGKQLLVLDRRHKLRIFDIFRRDWQ